MNQGKRSSVDLHSKVTLALFGRSIEILEHFDEPPVIKPSAVNDLMGFLLVSHETHTRKIERAKKFNGSLDDADEFR